MGRPALHLRVRIQDTDIDLITAHFKSKLLTFPPTDSALTTRASAPGSVPTRSIADSEGGTCELEATRARNHRRPLRIAFG